MFRVDGSGNITKNGSVIPVRCGAWFGLEGQHEPKDAEYNPDGAPLELYVGNMWWTTSTRTIQQTMTEIKGIGINTIRLPIAPQTLDPNDPQGRGFVKDGGALKNGAAVRQQNARQAMEDFIKLADKNDLNVIVDIHSCSNYVGWRAGRLNAQPPYVDADRDNYDFTREGYSCSDYNESKWLANLKDIAGLPKKLGVDNLIAIDIFNEPWDYTWAEWKALAESAYKAIDSVNKDVLVMVEGVGSETQAKVKVDHGDPSSNPNWGENFYGFKTAPLNIPKDRLVISPHTYGPSVFVQKQFMDPSQGNCTGLEGDEAAAAKCKIVINKTVLEKGWDEHFGFLRDQGYAMVIGEFGGKMNWPKNTSDATKWGHITTNVDAQWQNALVDYAKRKKIQACYWSINPESADTGGLYRHQYDNDPAGWGTWLGFDTEKTSLLKRYWDL